MMARDARRGLLKKQGGRAARAWLLTADTGEIVRLAGYDFDYGLDTLDELRAQGFKVPSSSDFVFSWGFYKQVKGHVFHKVHFGANGRYSAGARKRLSHRGRSPVPSECKSGNGEH